MEAPHRELQPLGLGTKDLRAGDLVRIPGIAITVPGAADVMGIPGILIAMPPERLSPCPGIRSEAIRRVKAHEASLVPSMYQCASIS
jgi:hypothetical protein